jgi:S-adenosylmethionine synthetase
MKTDFVFVSESLTKGHPDKLCDQISDAIVDSFVRQDSNARVDAECAVSSGIVFIAAHFHAAADVDVTATAREVILAAGYTGGEFNAEDCTILTSLRELPVDALPTARDDLSATPAAQQATVFGYACRDTPELMPLPIVLAHDLARALDRGREAGALNALSPDAKTQVAIEYVDRKPARVHSLSIVVSSNGKSPVSAGERQRAITEHVILPALATRSLTTDSGTRIFVVSEPGLAAGGPTLHSGLTGRKTAVDTYGDFARHGGSALSGKDPLRIDRMGAYAARYAAKNIVAAGLASECEVQLSYGIGQATPVSLNVDSFGTAQVSDAELTRRVAAAFDFRPGAILERFALREKLAGGTFAFLPTATYGHMGREDLGVPWETTDCIEKLLRRTR